MDDATLTGTDLGGSDATADTVAGATRGNGAVAAGTRIGRFVVVDRLGAGGMGEVYACHDPALDRRVAVKLLHPAADGSSATEQLMLRLRREAQAAAKMSHRNVVTVFDVGIAGERGEVFVAMELIEGGTLENWLTARPRTWREIVAMYAQAGRGLAAAHSAGIVHRDFKPSNVLVTPAGDAKVSDFGLATSGDGDRESATAGAATGVGPLTRTGAVMGTPMFMAPEQREGARVDARADLYAFCVALFRSVYGQYPFGEGFDEMVKRSTANELIEPPRRAPPALLRALRGGLDPDPAKRPASLAVLLDTLDRLIARRPRRAIAAAVAVVALGGAAAAIWASRPAPSESCGGARREIDEIWGPAQAQAIAKAFAATGLGFATDSVERASARLDTWRDRWVDAHTAACRATRVDHSQSEHAMDLRIACLERQRADLATLVDFLARGDADTVPRATQLALALPSAEACGGAPPLDDPALSRRLGEAELRLDAGRYEEGIPIAEEVLAAATKARARVVAARAETTLGRLQMSKGDYPTARETLFHASLEAQVTHQPELAATAWSATISALTGENAPAEDEARAYAQGQAAIDSAGGPLPLAQAILIQDHANYVARTLHDSAAAIPLLRQALELVRAHVDPEHPLVASILDTLGGALSETGDRAAGIAMGQEALAMRERLFGAEHPSVARSLHNLGVSMTEDSRFDDAEALFERALDLKIRVLGEHHPMVSNTLIEYEELLAVERRFDEALVMSRRDLALWIAVGGEGSDDELASRRELGDLLVVAGRPAEALEEYRRAKVALPTVRPLIELGRLADAEAEVAAVTGEPTVGLHLARARIALARHRAADAVKALAAARALVDPDTSTSVVADLELLDAEATGDRAKAENARQMCLPIRCSHWTADRLARADRLLSAR